MYAKRDKKARQRLEVSLASHAHAHDVHATLYTHMRMSRLVAHGVVVFWA